MIPATENWQPLEVESIQDHLGTFRNWCLCGGRSLDWIIGHTTRTHGDTDIGVFRSEVQECLVEIGTPRVFLCVPTRGLSPWDGLNIPSCVHDIWISDRAGEAWVLQIMVYDDEHNAVIYRRDPRVRWAKSAHSFMVRGVRVVNPLVSFLFKVNRSKFEDKDCHDVQQLIEALPKVCWDLLPQRRPEDSI